MCGCAMLFARAFVHTAGASSVIVLGVLLGAGWGGVAGSDVFGPLIALSPRCCPRAAWGRGCAIRGPGTPST